MRIATKTVFEMAKNQLGGITEEMFKTNEIIASGKRINRPSDDPVGMFQALQLKSEIANIEQLQRNMDFGTSWLSSKESALSQVQNLISDAKALCVQMGTDTTGAEERNSAALQVENMLEEIIALANTAINGRYVFAGSNTDSVPFDENGVYSGDSSAFCIKIGKDSTLEVGNDGEAVFTDVFSSFQELKTALEANDVSGITDAITRLDDNFDDMSAEISDVGSKMVRLETRGYILEDLDLTDTERLSNIEDADIAEAIIRLESMEVTYQAALAASAEVMKLSLANYID